MFRLLVCASLFIGACKGKDKDGGATGSAAAPKTEDPCKGQKLEGPIAWIADDYKNAIACAKQKQQPLVIDLWAPWCHTCLSMQTTVFLDKSFGDDNKKFV